MRSDRDRDDRISRGEWKGPPALFLKFDLNSDGFLTIQELENRPTPDAPNAQQQPGGAQEGPLTPEQLVQRMDDNGDGRISTDEFKEGGRRSFDFFDLDEDGFATLEEIETAIANAQSGQQGGSAAATAVTQSDLEAFVASGGTELSVEDVVELFNGTTLKVEATGLIIQTQADGRLNFVASNGSSRSGKWWVSESGEFCTEGLGRDRNVAQCGSRRAIQDGALHIFRTNGAYVKIRGQNAVMTIVE